MKCSSVIEPLYQRYGKEVCLSRPGSMAVESCLSFGVVARMADLLAGLA